MLVACSQVAPMRRMMKKLMRSMQHWTRGWMKDAKKEGSWGPPLDNNIMKYCLTLKCCDNHGAFFQGAERKRRN